MSALCFPGRALLGVGLTQASAELWAVGPVAGAQGAAAGTEGHGWCCSLHWHFQAKPTGLVSIKESHYPLRPCSSPHWSALAGTVPRFSVGKAFATAYVWASAGCASGEVTESRLPLLQCTWESQHRQPESRLLCPLPGYSYGGTGYVPPCCRPRMSTRVVSSVASRLKPSSQ